MRLRPRLLPALLVLLAAPALAQEPAPAPGTEPSPAAEPPPATLQAPPPAVAAEPLPPPPPPPPAEAPLPKLGLRFGAGFPEGVTASVVARPLPVLRLQAGPAWNYLAFGLQGGVTVTPLRWAVSPVLELSYGHFFGADINKVAKGAPAELKPLFSDVGYDYFNGQLGVEFGSPRGFTFSAGLGLAYLWSTLHGTATVVKNQGTPDEATVTIRNPSIRAVVPSLRLAMLYYF